jgi:GntR family transcriptional regulator
MSLVAPRASAKSTGIVPRYVRIAETLRRRLLDFRQREGTRLPSEPTLAREFGVSRETVREALALLRSEGLVYARTGRGTFVSPWPQQVGLRITQPINEPYVAGRPSSPKVLEQGYVAPSAEVTRALAVAAGRPVFRYTILRSIRGQAFRFGWVYVPEAVAERLDLRRLPRLTVSDKIEREAGLRLIRAHQSAIAIAAPANVAKALSLPVGSPVLAFHRVYYEESGRPAELAIDYQNPQRFPYEEVLVRTSR